jgi:hypothetical protein
VSETAENTRWWSVTFVGAVAGVIQGAVFSHVGTSFYSNDALRLFWFVLPPYVIILFAAAVCRSNRLASIVIALSTWIGVAFAAYGYVTVFFFMPPDGQKVFVFLGVCLYQTGGALLLLIVAAAIRWVGRRPGNNIEQPPDAGGSPPVR